MTRAASSRPALEISNAWRAAALPVGVALMIVSGAAAAAARAELAPVAGWRCVAVAASCAAASGWLGRCS